MGKQNILQNDSLSDEISSMTNNLSPRPQQKNQLTQEKTIRYVSYRHNMICQENRVLSCCRGKKSSLMVRTREKFRLRVDNGICDGR